MFWSPYYCLYMKWNNNAVGPDEPVCGCDLQAETNKHAYHTTNGWYAREVAKDGRDNWLKQYPWTSKFYPSLKKISDTKKFFNLRKNSPEKLIFWSSGRVRS